MLKLIYDFNELGQAALSRGAEYSDIINLPEKEKIGRAKYVPEENISELDDLDITLCSELKALGGESDA